MTVEVLERRQLAAEPPQTPVLGDEPVADEFVYTQCIEVVFVPRPAPRRGKPVVRQLPADWPYPPEEGY